MSSMTFIHSALRAAVSKICMDVGWNAAYSSSLTVLVDILNQYIKTLSRKAVEAANHAGRTEPTMEDMAFAFKKMPIDLNQLKDYILNVESSTLDIEIVEFPIKNQTNRLFNNYDPNEERPEYYHEWLPSLKCSESKSESDSQQISSQQDNNDTQKQQSIESIEKPIEENLQNVDKNVEKTVEDSEKEDNNNNNNNNNDSEMKTTIQNDENEQPETTPITLDEDAKTKLVFKFSLGKSLEDNSTDPNSNQNKLDKKITTLSQSTSTNDVLNHLKSSKAYLRSLQNSSMFENIENRKHFRSADCQRLPNEHKSRENSPEPEPENNPDSINLNNNTTNVNNINNTNVLSTINNEFDEINLKKLFGNKKKSRAKVSTNPTDTIDGPLEFSLKIKEIGNNSSNNTTKKERPKKENIEGKPSRPKKPKDKPVSIKVTGFGLSNENQSSSPKITNDLLMNETTENLIDSNNDTIISTSTPEKTPTKKRIYKRKDKLKDNIDGDGDSEPKPKKMKKSNKQDISTFDFNQSESSSIPDTGNKIKKNKKHKDNDTFKSMLNTSESNDLFKLDDSLSNSNINIDNESLLSDSTATPIKSSTKKSSGSNRSGNNNNTSNSKRSKSVNSKKAVSAEIVESSGDSSSDDGIIDDKNPVSLLVNPEQFDDLNMISNNNSNLKRHPSNSSLSSLHSSKHQPSPSYIDDYETNIDEPTTSKHIHSIKTKEHDSKKFKEEDISSSKDSSSSTNKHKKSKKHSKSKHHRHGDEKSHKKHKKSKDKDKNKVKEEKIKSKDKDKEKNYKPKLNIKFNVPEDSSINNNPDNNDKMDVTMPPRPPSPLDAYTMDPLPPPPVKEKVKSKHDSGSNHKKKSSKSTGNTTKEMESSNDNKNELIFIKDTTSSTKSKESKSKKNKIINVGDSLLEKPYSPHLNEKSSSSSKSKEDRKSKNYEIQSKSSSSVSKSSSKSNKKKEPEFEPEPVPEPVQEQQQQHIFDDLYSEDQCIVYTETIKIEGNIPEKLWTCPACSCPDNGTPMIGCDGCDYWYHYVCVGIVEDPSEEEQWFCPSCLKKKEKEAKEKRKQEKEKDKKKKEKEKHKTSLLASTSKSTKMNDDRDIVTITPVLPTPTSIPGIELPSSVSIYSLPPEPTPKSSRGRGRPRKDSTTSINSSSITITPIPGPSGVKSSKIGKKYSQNFEPQPQSQRRHQNLDIDPGPSSSKAMKETCPVCKSIEGPGEAVDMIKCDICFQWYHWHCVGINNTPSPDSSWYCPKCKKSKFNKRLWDNEFNLDDDLQEEGENNEVLWEEPTRCDSCKPDRIPEDSEWICCDFCNVWYHFICEKIEQKPKKNESWFCSSCVRKQKTLFRMKERK